MRLTCMFSFILLFGAVGLVVFIHLQDPEEIVHQQTPAAQWVTFLKVPDLCGKMEQISGVSGCCKKTFTWRNKVIWKAVRDCNDPGSWLKLLAKGKSSRGFAGHGQRKCPGAENVNTNPGGDEPGLEEGSTALLGEAGPCLRRGHKPSEPHKSPRIHSVTSDSVKLPQGRYLDVHLNLNVY